MLVLESHDFAAAFSEICIARCLGCCRFKMWNAVYFLEPSYLFFCGFASCRGVVIWCVSPVAAVRVQGLHRILVVRPELEVARLSRVVCCMQELDFFWFFTWRWCSLQRPVACALGLWLGCVDKEECDCADSSDSCAD